MECERLECNICHKSLSLIRFKCVYCNNDFCIKHRTPEDHICTHDFKKDNKARLKTSLESCAVKETHGYVKF